MANIKSQIKRIRQTEKQRLRNKAVRSALKTHSKKFREALASGERDTAEKVMAEATSALDRAARKGIVHRNQAANKKSKMAKAWKTFEARPPVVPKEKPAEKEPSKAKTKKAPAKSTAKASTKTAAKTKSTGKETAAAKPKKTAAKSTRKKTAPKKDEK